MVPNSHVIHLGPRPPPQQIPVPYAPPNPTNPPPAAQLPFGNALRRFGERLRSTGVVDAQQYGGLSYVFQPAGTLFLLCVHPFISRLFQVTVYHEAPAVPIHLLEPLHPFSPTHHFHLFADHALSLSPTGYQAAPPNGGNPQFDVTQGIPQLLNTRNNQGPYYDN